MSRVRRWTDRITQIGQNCQIWYQNFYFKFLNTFAGEYVVNQSNPFSLDFFQSCTEL